MNEKNDSLLEIAFEEMKKKKKPKTLEKICKDVFEIKGIKYDITLEELSEMAISIYPQLLKQGMKKEDARAFSSAVAFNAPFFTASFSSSSTSAVPCKTAVSKARATISGA